MPPFYGQSASLLRFFVNRGATKKITRFGFDAPNLGYAQALKEHYRKDNGGEQERLRKKSVACEQRIDFTLVFQTDRR